jgi:preprotein translocase subunit SecD
MKRVFLFICIVALFASILACTLSSLTGPHLVVTLAPESGKQWDEANMAAARDVILHRLKSFGVNGATATISSDGNLQINLPVIDHPESVFPLLTQMGEITFVDSPDSLWTGDAVDASLRIVLTGSDIKNSSVTLGSVGDYQIAFTFTPEGSQKLSDYTSNNVGRYLVIACDGTVISSPRVSSAITDGKAIVQGNLTEESANLLIAQLKSVPLPFPLIVLDTTVK